MAEADDWRTVELPSGHIVVFDFEDDESDYMTAVCPLCGGQLRQIPYDDGDGRWDIAIRCTGGDVDTWV